MPRSSKVLPLLCRILTLVCVFAFALDSTSAEEKAGADPKLVNLEWCTVRVYFHPAFGNPALRYTPEEFIQNREKMLELRRIYPLTEQSRSLARALHEFTPRDAGHGFMIGWAVEIVDRDGKTLRRVFTDVMGKQGLS